MNFEELHEEYGGMIARIAASYAPPGAARDDLRQDIALALMGALDSFRGQASLKTYVYRIANNCGVDYLRGREPGFCEVDDLELRSTEHDPEESLLVTRRRERLAEAIRRLPLSYRQPLVLRLEGLSYEEIAEALGISASNVGVRIHRAKEGLKELIHE